MRSVLIVFFSLKLLDDAGITYSATTIPKWGHLLEGDAVNEDPIYW